MTIELPAELEVSLKAPADARGLPADLYFREVLERGLQAAHPKPKLPLKSALGMWAKYGISISDEEIAENRADMSRSFGENF